VEHLPRKGKGKKQSQSKRETMWAEYNKATEVGLPKSFDAHITHVLQMLKLQNSTFALLGFGLASI
jgi:hypothetical protein